MLTLSTPRLDLGNQVPPVGLVVIRLEIRIEDVQAALVYAGSAAPIAAAQKSISKPTRRHICDTATA